MEVLQSITEIDVRVSIGSPQMAVDLTRDLIWAEAGRQVVDFQKISVPSRIYAKDGGIDGTTIDIEPQRSPGLLSKGKTYFQIKWGETFDPTKEKYLKKEITTQSGLKPSLKSLAEDNGKYVLIWFGGRFKGQQKEECLERLQDLFRTHKFPKMEVSVLDQDDIAQICNLHPVIISRYFKPLNQYFQTIDSWKDRFWKKEVHEKNIESVIQSNASTILTLINSNRSSPYQPVQLISHDADQHLINRILIYQTLMLDSFSQRTICVNAEEFGPPLSTTLESRNDLNQIIVVDNCKKEHHEKLLDVLGQRSRRLNMIILSTDGSAIINQSFAKIGWRGSERSAFLREIEKGRQNEQIASSELIYDSQIPQLKKIILPEDLITTYSEIVGKYGHEILSNVKRILRYLSLFTSIGSENNRTKELEFLAKNAGFGKDNWLDFAEIIHVLREFKLIQGEYYIKIPSQSHREFFIQEWWEIYGPSFDFNEFLTNTYVFSENLASRLIDSLSYVTVTEKGKEITKILLGQHGIFSSGKLLQDMFGTRLFSKLTEADPESAVKCLTGTIGTWSSQELEKYDLRRDIVFALEKITWWQDLFYEGTVLLLQLAEAENEPGIANNASGVFTALFSPGYGKVAATETPPLKRFSIIEEIFRSGSDKRISLALQACNAALESTHFSRMISGEGPWYGRDFKPWMPKTFGELFDYYRTVWKFVEEQSSKLKSNLQIQSADILTSRSREIIRIQDLADMVIKTLDILSKNPNVDKEKIVDAIGLILKYETSNLTAKSIENLQEIDKWITGSDYHSKLRRFVGMRLFLEVDDSKDDEKLIELAEEGINKSLLKNEIKWLVRKNVKKAHRFGYQVGKKDKGFSLLSAIIVEQKKTTIEDQDLSFLAGYCSAIFEVNQDKCDQVLDVLSRSKKTVQWVPGLLYGSRINFRDKDLVRLIRLAARNEIKLIEFNRLIYGGVTRLVTENTFMKMVSLLKKKEESYFILVELYNQYFLTLNTSSTLPESITLSLLTSGFIIKKSQGEISYMDIFSYVQIAKKFVNQYPKSGLQLIKKLLEKGNEENSFLSKYSSQFEEILTELTSKTPDEVWSLIKQYLGPPIDIIAFRLRNWLRGSNFFEKSPGAITLFNPELIFKWADEDQSYNAILLAYVVPNTLRKDGTGICWAREVLVKYGSLDKVRHELIANFHTEGFSGSEVEHFAKKKAELIEIKKDETDLNVIKWINEYEADLNVDIKRAKQFEESFNF